MSWVNGIQDTQVSLSPQRAASPEPRAFTRMLRWVSTTPLGSLVEPDENWMNAMSSGLTACTWPAFEMSSTCSAKKARGLEAVEGRLFAGAAGKGADAIECLPVGVDEGLAQFPGDAQQLVFVLVTDAEGNRHRHDPAQHAGPEGIEELLVVC